MVYCASRVRLEPVKQLTGGAIKHCDAEVLKPNPSLRMMGKKTEMEVVTVMMKLCNPISALGLK